MGRIKRDDCCCTDWRNTVKLLWENYQEVVKTVEVNGQRYNPDANGMVSFDVHTEVIDQTDYYTMICTMTGGTTSSLTPVDGYWLLMTQNLYDMGTHYDLNDSDSLAIADEGGNFLISVNG